MKKIFQYCVFASSVFWLMPVPAVQIIGDDDGTSFAEIYQDDHFLRLENGRLIQRYHDGDCLIADEQTGDYIEGDCGDIAEKISAAITQKMTEFQQQYDGMDPGQMAAYKQMMRQHQGDEQLKESGKGEVAGFPTIRYTVGSREISISPKLLSLIKKEMNYKQYLKSASEFEAAFSQAKVFGGDEDKTQAAENELAKTGYVVKITDAAAVGGMNSMMLKFLPPEKRKEMMANAGDATVVLRVTSVKTDKVKLKNYRPDGEQVSIDDFLNRMFRE